MTDGPHGSITRIAHTVAPHLRGRPRGSGGAPSGSGQSNPRAPVTPGVGAGRGSRGGSAGGSQKARSEPSDQASSDRIPGLGSPSRIPIHIRICACPPHALLYLLALCFRQGPPPSGGQSMMSPRKFGSPRGSMKEIVGPRLQKIAGSLQNMLGGRRVGPGAH